MKTDEKILFTLKYNSPLIVFSLLIRLVFLIFSILILIFIDEYNYFTILLFIIAIYSIFGLIDIGLFKKLTITNKNIIKEWYFFKKSIFIDNNLFARRASSPISINRLYFGSKKNRFIVYFFILNIYCVNNRNKKMQELKEVLIDLNIIKEDDFGWYYGY